MDNSFKEAVVYGLYDSSGDLRYVGKANDASARLKSHMRDCYRRDTPVSRWLRENGAPAIKPIASIPSGCDWKVVEKAIIQESRGLGDKLLNVASGGDQPFCPPEKRAEAARAAVKARDPEVWRFNRDMGQALRDGLLTELTKGKLRELAALRPKEYGRWAKV